MSKKKILILNYEFPPLGGGAANATKYLLQEFAKNPNLQITLITSSTNQFRIENPSENISIHYLDIHKKGNIHYQSNKDLLTYSWKAYWYAKKLHKTQNFDLVHAFFGIPCGFIAQRLNIPYIISLRGSDVPFYNPRFEKLDKILFQRLSRNIWKNSKATIANSQGLKDLALKTASKQKIQVIYNGVDISEFQANSTPQKIKKIKILAVGRLIPRKGFDLLIRASQGLDVTITVIGDGPERDNLKTLSQDLQVPVTFTGAIDHDEIVQHYQEHNLFVLPSANEGMSNTVLEAMACGLPIIITNTGGTQELVQDNGWVIERTVEALRYSLRQALATPKQLIDMGNKSRQRVESMDWTRVSKQYLNVYQNIKN